MLTHDDIIFLQEHLSFTKKLKANDLQDMVAAISKLAFKQGEIILSRDKECNGLVIVKYGQLRAFIELENGKEITLYRLLANDICILSASCVLKNITFDVHLETEKDSVLYIIPALCWETLTAKNIYVKEFTLNLIADRFSEVMWVMEQIVSKNMRQRIAAFLLEQSILEATDTLTVTHETIARNIGTAREVISRVLKHLENDGIIRLSRGQVQITDMEVLTEIGR